MLTQHQERDIIFKANAKAFRTNKKANSKRREQNDKML